jgi:hypothetical protein
MISGRLHLIIACRARVVEERAASKSPTIPGENNHVTGGGMDELAVSEVVLAESEPAPRLESASDTN